MSLTERFDADFASLVDFIEVSPEMTTLVGHGRLAGFPVPVDPVVLSIGFGAEDTPPTLHIDADPCLKALSEDADAGYRLMFLVSRSAMVRLGGQAFVASEQFEFHLPSELRAIVLALREPPTSAETRTTYRLAKSIELICEAIRLFEAGEFIPVSIEGGLSVADTRKLIAARRLIDERWTEKLTLDGIARACGLNRAKLTRGFREMFDCTIAEALADRRLSQASRLLLTTDLPVSSVGYEAGYLNNASFARAFGRHFGVAPSAYRACRLAA